MMLFAPLPLAFTQFEKALLKLDAVSVTKPPPMEDIGRRLRADYLLARADGDGYQHLTVSQIRKLPYAYWIKNEPSLPEIDGPLVQKYWVEVLPDGLGDNPRRAKRWLTPVFFIYCEYFDLRSRVFIDFASRISEALPKAVGGFANRLMTLQKDVSFFTPLLAPIRIADALMRHDGNLDEAFESMLLWPAFDDTALGRAVFEAALDMRGEKLRDIGVISRLYEWAVRLSAPIAKTSLRVKFANAVLEPWMGRQTPDQVKSLLLDFFIDGYGDPRIEGNRQFQWKGVSDQSVSVIKSWLAGDTLRGFMKVLENTADEIWRYREKFWMAYYERGYIQEAWLALGFEAARYIKSRQPQQNELDFGRLESGALPNQSVLLLKIGDIVFTEWSHNGSLRAFRDGGRGAPVLYRNIYHGADLRDSQSMDFHDGLNERNQLTHANSAGGTWQRKARDFIRKNTGIQLNDWEIL